MHAMHTPTTPIIASFDHDLAAVVPGSGSWCTVGSAIGRARIGRVNKNPSEGTRRETIDGRNGHVDRLSEAERTLDRCSGRGVVQRRRAVNRIDGNYIVKKLSLD